MTTEVQTSDRAVFDTYPGSRLPVGPMNINDNRERRLYTDRQEEESFPRNHYSIDGILGYPKIREIMKRTTAISDEDKSLDSVEISTTKDSPNNSCDRNTKTEENKSAKIDDDDSDDDGLSARHAWDGSGFWC